MAKGREFKTLFLASQGIDDKGRKLSEKETIAVKDATKELIETIVTTLSKCYAQIGVAKAHGWIDEELGDKIIESAREPQGTKKNRKGYFIAEIEAGIKKALETAGKVSNTDNSDLF